MKKILLVLLVMIATLSSMAQQRNYESHKSIIETFPAGAEPNFYDSIYQQNLQELLLPDNLKNFTPPASVDNSKLPYLRPVFSQVGASCGQASAIGYNFTYEMDHARGVSADTSINQYPTHFVYNFANTGYEYFGVSYFNSFEILKKCGTMNVKDYGGFTDGGGRWITGYDLYYNGMHNRIEDVYTIKTNTSKGILTLKNWIYNHLGESLTGGIASFYIGWRDVKTLPAGTPEQGKHIVTDFYAPASHAMTIVGYNDSIRYDYNNDGLYTNTIDLNNDSIIDVRDWEIGGCKFVNSYGITDYDSGFCYMMYRTLAEGYNIGGIWNNAVHVVKVKSDYKPLLTMKIRLKHIKRSALRVMAGVSADAASLLPDHTMEFPIFNFQGGDFPMQGPGSHDTLKSIEFGLDITPLLSHIQDNKTASFFLSVEENDPYSLADGSIESFTVIDYSNASPQGSECMATPVEIVNNSVTNVKVNVSSAVNKVKISNNTVPAFTQGQPLAMQLNASGGQPPYTWSLNYDYTRIASDSPYTNFDGIRLFPLSETDTMSAVALDFGFPFYGKKYDTVYVNLKNGFLQFTPDLIPWPYNAETDLLLQSFKTIAPLATIAYSNNFPDEGAWYEQKAGLAKFRWMFRKKIGDTYYPYEFQAKLAADGTITFNYRNISIVTPDRYFSGISDGDKKNFDISGYQSEYDANRFNQVIFSPPAYPDELKINQNGLVECTPTSAQQVYTVDCKVIDYRNISDSKQFLLSSGIVAELKLHAGNDTIIDKGEDVRADLILTNLSGNTFTNIKSVLSISDIFISLTDTVEIIAGIGPYTKLIIPDAFRFSISPDAIDGQNFIINVNCSSNLLMWKNSFPARINSSLLKSNELKCTKPDNELLLPGEAGTLRYTLSNIGHSNSTVIQADIVISGHEMELISSATQSFGSIQPGQRVAVDFQVKVSDSTLLGTQIPVKVNVTEASEIVLSDTFYIRIGKLPVMVIDLDIKHESAPVIYQKIIDLGYLAENVSEINPRINESQSVFLCLGKFSDRYILSYSEGRLLTDYLDQGGNLYIESLNFWRDDLKTSLQPRFNIETKNKFHKFDTLTGEQGSFVDGNNFLNTGYQVSMYYLLPLGKAFTLFHDESYGCSVANDAGLFKTIGSLFAFSGMDSANDSSSQSILMQKYLDFFNIKRNSVRINEPPPFTENGYIEIYPNPASETAYFALLLNEIKPVKINIYDLNGNHITELRATSHGLSEPHIAKWDLSNKSGQRVSTGLYFCRVVTDNEVMQGKILVK
jgi:hypothetical protein